MKPKKRRLVVTFESTAAAMGMEKQCAAEGAPGRLIPLPVRISADCGLAWCAACEDRDALLALMEKHRIRYGEVIEMEW